MFIFQTNAIWAHTTCLFLCCVHFLSPLVKSAHALVQNKVNWGPRHGSLSTFSKKLWSFIIAAIYSFLPINENAFYKATTHWPKFANKMLHYWSVNLRVAREFTVCSWHVLFSFRLIPTQLTDNTAVCGLWGGQWPVILRAARKSTGSKCLLWSH